MILPKWLAELWDRCRRRFTGVLSIHFVRGEPTKATIEEHVRPDE